MIGQHPELFGLPELKLFAYPTIGELDASLPTDMRERGFAHRSPGLVRAVAELEFGGQSDDALVASRAWLRERPSWTGAHVLDLLMGRVNPRVAIEKSPENVVEDGPLTQLARAYPRARYLHLTRHPIATIGSMNKHLRRSLPGHGNVDLTAHCIQTWLDCERRIMAFTKRLPVERWLRIRAEDVLNDPTPNLVAVARWLSIRSDASGIEAMRHPERSPFARLAATDSGVSGGNDPVFLADPRPHPVDTPATLEAPADWSTNPGTWAGVKRAAEELGYFR